MLKGRFQDFLQNPIIAFNVKVRKKTLKAPSQRLPGIKKIYSFKRISNDLSRKLITNYTYSTIYLVIEILPDEHHRHGVKLAIAQ